MAPPDRRWLRTREAFARSRSSVSGPGSSSFRSRARPSSSLLRRALFHIVHSALDPRHAPSSRGVTGAAVSGLDDREGPRYAAVRIHRFENIQWVEDTGMSATAARSPRSTSGPMSTIWNTRATGTAAMTTPASSLGCSSVSARAACWSSACGTGRVPSRGWALPRAELVGVDSSLDMLGQAARARDAAEPSVRDACHS